MPCSPSVKLEEVKVATPEAFKVPIPRLVAPSLNVTVPVGVTAPVTVAVKVTDRPKTVNRNGATAADRGRAALDGKAQRQTGSRCPADGKRRAPERLIT